MTDSEEYEVACQARMKAAHFRRKKFFLVQYCLFTRSTPVSNDNQKCFSIFGGT